LVVLALFAKLLFLLLYYCHYVGSSCKASQKSLDAGALRLEEANGCRSFFPSE
jgi:hypothetical protein